MSLDIFNVESWINDKSKRFDLSYTLSQICRYTSADISYQEIFNDAMASDLDNLKEYISHLYAKYRHSEDQLRKIITPDAIQLSTVLIVNIQYMPAIHIIIKNICEYAERNGQITIKTFIDKFNNSVPDDNFFKPEVKVEEIIEESEEIEPEDL